MSKNYNIGFLCTEKNVEIGLGAKTALTLVDAKKEESITYNELNEKSSKFAKFLELSGLKTYDRVGIFLPKCFDVFFAYLGALKLEAVPLSIFSNFGSQAIEDRFDDAKPKVIVTSSAMFPKLKNILKNRTYIEKIVISGNFIEVDTASEVVAMDSIFENCSSDFNYKITTAETPATLHYTSGSTGKPKGVLHVHQYLEHITATFRDVHKVSADDIYWCTADSGWVTGTSYGILAPFAAGVHQIQYSGKFNAVKWFELMTTRCNVMYTAPTTLRMLMQQYDKISESVHNESLKRIYCVGEPLNPEVINWAEKVFGVNVYDTWFQTETGGIMITNSPDIKIKPGSMGLPVKNIEACVVKDDGNIAMAYEHGSLCIKAVFSSMFREYYNNKAKYDERFNDGFYYTGDTAYIDNDGYFWFSGRDDDIIVSAGHLLSPFEIESALIEVPGIAESAAIGVPDELLNERVVAYIALSDEAETISQELELKLRIHVSNKVGSIAAPQEIIPLKKLPKNMSGKILRRVLKATYLGNDPGDISSMEE